MDFLEALEDAVLEMKPDQLLNGLGDQSRKGSLVWLFCLKHRLQAAEFGLRLKGHSTRFRAFHGKEKVTNDYLNQYMSSDWVDFLLDASTYKKHSVKTELLYRLKAIQQNTTTEEYKQSGKLQ